MTHPKSTTESNSTDLLALAKSVLTLTQSLIAHLSDLSHPCPSFQPTSSGPPLDLKYESLRSQLNTTATDLLRLVNGPKNTFRTLFCTHYDLAAYQVALELNFFGAVPLEGAVRVEDVAAKVGMDVDRVSRVLRFLGTHRVFKELEGKDCRGMFEHTAASAMVARDHRLRDAFLMQADEMFNAASQTSTCVRNAPWESNAVNSPFSTRHGMSLYQFYEKNRDKAARFASAMAGITQLDRQVKELRDEFDWGSLPKGSIVDVGGGSGHISISLARAFPHLDFIIQDVSTLMLDQGTKLWAGDLQNRVRFMQHDFFQPQPIYNASAFFMRQIMHNWTDVDCIRLFRAFIPALEQCPKGTPLLINDTIIPGPGEKTCFEEYQLRQLDIGMWVVLGAKQRSREEFEMLMKEADPRFRLVKVDSTGAMGLLEVHLGVQER